MIPGPNITVVEMLVYMGLSYTHTSRKNYLWSPCQVCSFY